MKSKSFFLLFRQFQLLPPKHFFLSTHKVTFVPVSIYFFLLEFSPPFGCSFRGSVDMFYDWSIPTFPIVYSTNREKLSNRPSVCLFSLYRISRLVDLLFIRRLYFSLFPLADRAALLSLFFLSLYAFLIDQNRIPALLLHL